MELTTKFMIPLSYGRWLWFYLLYETIPYELLLLWIFVNYCKLFLFGTFEMNGSSYLMGKIIKARY